MRTTMIAMAMVLVLGLAGCGDDDTGAGATTVDLAGLEFRSTSRVIDGADAPLVPGSVVSIVFDEAGISAHAGCNRIFGGARIEGDVLAVDMLAMTEMACEPALMDQDQWLIDLLQSRPTLAVDGDELTITSATSVLTLLDRRVADPDRALVGTEWTVDTLVSRDAASSLPAGVEAPTLTLDEDGRFHVFLGCNRGGGGYELDGSTLAFGPAGITRMLCDPDAMEVESAVLAVLESPVTWTIEGPALTLDGDGVGLRLRAP